MARLDYGAKLKEFRTRATLKSGLSIRYERDLAVPYAARTPNGAAVIVLPTPDPTWDEEKWIDWDFAAEHELGHLMPECIDMYDVLQENKIDTSTFFGGMLNIMEDHRQEWTNFNEYAGRKLRLSKGRRLFWDKFDVNNFNAPGADLHRQAMETQFVWDNMIREEWMHSLIGSSEKLIECMNDQQIEWLDKLQKGDYESALKSGITAQEEYDLTKRIVEEVYGFDADEEEQKAQQSNSEGNGQDGEDDGEGDSKGKGKAVRGGGDDDAEAGESGGKPEEAEGEEGESGKGDKTGKRGVEATVSYADLMAHNHAELEDGPEGASYASLKIVYDDREWNDYTPVDPSEYELFNYADGSESAAFPNERYRPLLDSEHGKGLAKHVRRLLQVRSQSTYQHGLKRGKVSPKSIYRGAMKGPAQQRVFKKRYDSDVLDTAVFILIDASGSMGGYGGGAKIVNAGISTKLLNEAISSIGIPLEIAMFDDGYSGPRHALLKSFTQRVDSGILMDRFASACNKLMKSNADGESILWAYERLMKQKQKRKVLIVLSDGQPACSRGDIKTYTKQVIEEIESRKTIDLYAIGIETLSVNDYYTNRAVITSADQLEGALLNVIEKKILN